MKNNAALHSDKTKSLCIEIPLMVNTYDIDVAGHVNNIVYIRWLEDMRNEFFSQNFSLEKLLEVDHYPVVISTDVKYKKQIKLFDKPVGEIFLHNYSHGMFVFKAEISINNLIVFMATQKCVLMNLKDHKMFKGNIYDLVNRIL
ncbi:MAG: thioesterase family protein [Ignavibacteriales bacterium]|nr:thioesterase family protein [Ignavibacteriales bacterium]